MRHVNYDEPVKNLPDAFAKHKDSNNYKIIQIHKESVDKQLKVLQNMSDSFDIDKAYGATLDLWYGEKFILKRGLMNDEQYRICLKGKQMQNATDGSFTKLVKALAFVLRCSISDIHIVESETSNSIIVKDIPLATLLSAGFTTTQVLDIIKNLLAVNVSISEYGFTGTFEFGEVNDYDEDNGFVDLDGNIGGYLGLMERMIL